MKGLKKRKIEESDKLCRYVIEFFKNAGEVFVKLVRRINIVYPDMIREIFLMTVDSVEDFS